MRDGTTGGTKGMSGGSAMGECVRGVARRQAAEAARARGGAGALPAILEGGGDDSASDDASLAQWRRTGCDRTCDQRNEPALNVEVCR